MTTTPLQPVELPPFELYPLLSTVFFNHERATSAAGLASPAAPASSILRLGQLVSSSVAGGEVANKAEVVRCLEASRDRIWVGGSRGNVQIYATPTRDDLSVAVPSPSTPTRRISANEIAQVELLEQVSVTANRKSVDRIVLLERIGRIAMLSEGLLTFHSLPSFAPLPVAAFPSVKGVVALSLDEDEIVGGGSRDAMHICVVKRRTIYILRVMRDGLTIIGDLPLPGGALLAVLRGRYICIANSEEYSIVDLDRSVLLPVIPISQGANIDPLPDRPQSPSSTPISPGGSDPRQRPALACVGVNEFLVASHTGSTTLGVFVTETGEACRGTLAWASNLRSLYVDSVYVTALLHNNTIEIHSLHTLEIVQVIQISPSLSGFSSFQPRSLSRLASGFDIGSSGGATKVELISLPLLPASSSSSSTDAPWTPNRSRGNLRGSSVSRSTNESHTLSKAFLLGKNGICALAPLTLVAQADALIEKDRLQDALILAGQIESSDPSDYSNPELDYIFLRTAYIALHSTLFEDAFSLFLRSKCDPRLVVRLFADLRETLLSSNEKILVCRGVEVDVLEARTIDDYILASLTRNYSPHVEPDIESASSTSQLRLILSTTARDSLCRYLDHWRERRRNVQGGNPKSLAGDSRKVDMVVDTALVKLLAEERESEKVLSILMGPNDCVIAHIESSLLEAGLYQLLANIHLKRGGITETLDVWTKLVDQIYIDDEFNNGLNLIYNLLFGSKDQLLVEKYGLWLISHDRSLGIKLFTDPEQTLIFETRDLFAKISRVDQQAGDLFLESTVLQKRDSDSRLDADLVKRYIDRLISMLSDPTIKMHLRQQEKSYRILVSQSPAIPPTFLSYLAAQYTPESTHAAFDLVRLKTILFLGTSSNYDLPGTKKELEAMEMKGLKGLTLERAIVYGRLRLDRQSLSLLLHTLGDMISSEMYSHQSGDPLLASDLSHTATVLKLPISLTKPPKLSDESDSRRRHTELSRLLIEMCLSRRNGVRDEEVSTEEGKETAGEEEPINERREQVTRLLETQSLHLDTLEVLPLIPSHWPIDLLSPFLVRSLRRSLHVRQESALLKSIALSENAVAAERLGDRQTEMGGTLAETGEGKAGILVADIEEVIEVKLGEKSSKATRSRKSRIGRRG